MLPKMISVKQVSLDVSLASSIHQCHRLRYHRLRCRAIGNQHCFCLTLRHESHHCILNLPLLQGYTSWSGGTPAARISCFRLPSAAPALKSELQPLQDASVAFQ